jgi:Crp-like helix-turn-helix domain
MKLKVLQGEFARAGPLQHILLLYTQALITQISQTAVCNRLHSVQKRLCRWLLLCHDRVKGDELRMTQEFISNMLGGRRESVTVAAGYLQDAGLIHYARGHIRIINHVVYPPSVERPANPGGDFRESARPGANMEASVTATAPMRKKSERHGPNRCRLSPASSPQAARRPS